VHAKHRVLLNYGQKLHKRVVTSAKPRVQCTAILRAPVDRQRLEPACPDYQSFMSRWTALRSFFLERFSPGGQRWQNLQ